MLINLDFDRDPPRDLLGAIVWTCKTLRLTLVAVRYDRTRRGWHVVIGVVEYIDPTVTVAIQAILGSDPHRETYNLVRAQLVPNLPAFWRARWNVLYSRHARPKGRR